MRIETLRRLRGPNIYCSHPAVMALVDLEELAGRETSEIAGFTQRLLATLPGLADHHCAAGKPGGLVTKLTEGTFFGHVLEHVTLELSHLIGRDVYFGKTLWAGEPGLFRLIIECPEHEWTEDPVAGDLLALAETVVTELVAGRRADAVVDARQAGGKPVPGPELQRVAMAHDENRLGVTAAALARVARQRGIPVRRPADVGLLELGYGCHRRLVWAASTEQTSAVGVDVACDKAVTKQLLSAAGIPVPEGTVVHDAAEAVEAFDRLGGGLGGRVVVKPVSGNHGRDVFIVTTAEEARSAFAVAGGGGGLALVEEYVVGTDYRVLVVGDQVVAAELSAAQVTGDGVLDIAALVERANADPRRGVGHDRPLTRITLDDAVLGYLDHQGLTPASVPRGGQVVKLRHNANLSTGGTSKDVTDVVHPAVARMCARAAAIVGLDICGIDLRLRDITQPPGDCLETGGIIEINASPGLRMHLQPSEGRRRDVADYIIDRLYPPGMPSRVPIVSVTGTNGKTSTVRLIAHLLRHSGLLVGMTTTEGVYIGHDLVHDSDASGPRSADIVLSDPAVEAAVLETARGGIARRGLAYDHADVAVVTNITSDHIGTDGVDTMDDLIGVKALVAEEIREHGHLVLNADDRHSAGLARRPSVRDQQPVISYFSVSPGNPVITGHLRDGGRAYLLDDGDLIEAAGHARATLASVDDLALCPDGQPAFMVANVLAAVAAARSLGVSVATVRTALESLEPSKDNSGRLEMFHVGEVPVILDYAHNPAALAAVGQFVHERWGRDGVAVLTLPGDRTNDQVAESAQAVAQAFDRVVIYEDLDLRGREPGEMTKLIEAALDGVRPGICYESAASLEQAVTRGLALAESTDPVLVVYEKLAPAQELLAGLGAGRTVDRAADRAPGRASDRAPGRASDRASDRAPDRGTGLLAMAHGRR
jgi:cyanophycin synthetase